MQRYILLFLAIAVTIVTFVTVSHKPKPGISGGGSTVAPTRSVPLPTGEDVIRMFIQYIDEGKILDAISLMDGNLITSDSVKQQYGVVFHSFDSIGIQDMEIEERGRRELGPDEEQYRVDLLITLKSHEQSGMWENGVNTRWITVKKQEGRFMIHKIATGP